MRIFRIIAKNVLPYFLVRKIQNKNVCNVGKEYDQPDSLADKVFSALRAGDIEQIETSLTIVANNMRADILLIGLSCLIIEREGIYIEAGYRSYLEYSGRLFEKLEIAPQTLSDAKNIMAAYIDHYKGLSKYGFKLGRNAHKLRYLLEIYVKRLRRWLTK